MRIQSTDTLSARFTSEDFRHKIGLRARGRVYMTRSTHSDRVIVVDVQADIVDTYTTGLSYEEIDAMTCTLSERCDVFVHGRWACVTTIGGTYAQFA